MTGSSQSEQLRVRQMHVIWRDAFAAGDPPADFLATSLERMRALACYASDSEVEPYSARPELLRVIDRVSKSVAPGGYSSLLYVQFAALRLADLRPLLAEVRKSPRDLTPEQTRDFAARADTGGHWIEVVPVLVLHRAGVGIVEYYARFAAPEGGPGFTPEEAIENVRLGISTQLLAVDEGWRQTLPDWVATWSQAGWLDAGDGRFMLVNELRAISREVFAARLSGATTSRRSRRMDSVPRATGSRSVILIETEPQAGRDLTSFVGDYATVLRGIGSMDKFYQERADWIIERDLAENLSTDAELGVYLLGKSELVLCNEMVSEVVRPYLTRLRTDDMGMAYTYLYMHYAVLMTWLYLQEVLVRTYLQRLDALVASAPPRRRDVIGLLQGALADLVQYQEFITPYSTRVEFLERALQRHNLDHLTERFENRQELLLEYTSEYHDFREARASVFLNWLAGILTGAALADLIVTLAGITPDQPTLYVGITIGSIAVVLAILGLVQSIGLR